MGRRRKKKEDEPKSDEFIVLFTALSMILLAFFIMLNSLATIDEARSRIVLNSLIGTFGVLPGFKQGEFGPEMPHKKKSRKQPQNLKRRVQALLEIHDLQGANVAERSDGRVVIRFESRLLFASGSQRINPRSFPQLDGLADLIVRVGFPVRVEGHTDVVPSSGPQSNWYLSAARAAAVYRYLHHAAGVPADMLTAAGYGATRPLRTGETQQRRVEVVFLPPVRKGGS
ncbi:hypothetical protein FIV42_11625 [Persicimonas caeni]|uniref:OmpA-like domain-containing protein n=1 Tax=Persicimonas caeni TaxID=2292766 RepID=A0A4Y6PSQ9_PERCE|nr:OmpA family protein [Persicimonas caeni]QDG51366.1 hypothetical protein FIV42_11625 [Persicimonas caeni]QED32587.1 OmpA family protein [Persicimonas caeni]